MSGKGVDSCLMLAVFGRRTLSNNRLPVAGSWLAAFFTSPWTSALFPLRRGVLDDRTHLLDGRTGLLDGCTSLLDGCTGLFDG